MRSEARVTRSRCRAHAGGRCEAAEVGDVYATRLRQLFGPRATQFSLSHELAKLADNEASGQREITCDSSMRFSEGLEAEHAKRYANLVLMGQDIAEYGGAFKITDGLRGTVRQGRVCATRRCAKVGDPRRAALGLSIRKGMKAMMEMQFADFASERHQRRSCNNFAKDATTDGGRMPMWWCGCPPAPA